MEVFLPGGSYDALGGNVATFSDTLANGSYSYHVDPLASYLPVASTGNFSVNGSGVSITLGFYMPRTYTVTFHQSGLPGTDSWTVAFQWLDVYGSRVSYTSSGPNQSFAVRNDSFSFTVNGPRDYGVTPSSGTFTVNGENLVIDLAFHVGRYSLRFTETGLAAGTNWTVAVNGSANSTTTSVIQTYFDNGTYPFQVTPIGGYFATPLSGYLQVSGSDVSQPIVFTLATYSVTFTTSGLPIGNDWSIDLNGTSRSGVGASLQFLEGNGTYPYTVGNVPGYRAERYSGAVTVAAFASTVVVNWSRTTYAVTFEESGLAAGTSWGVTVNGTSYTSSRGTLQVVEPNGSFPFVVNPLSGYTALPSNSSFAVDNASVLLLVNFTSVPGGSTGVSFAPGSTLFYGVVGAVVAAAAAGAVLLARARGKKKTPT